MKDNMSSRGTKAGFKTFILFLIGGFLYLGVEMLFRGYTFSSMFLLGGLCFVAIGQINEIFPWEMPLISQMGISTVIVTTLEFFFGIVLNIFMGLEIWDYSALPYNLMGQICLLFSIGWFFLSLPAIVLDDFLRYFLFHEEFPHYNIFL